MLLKCSFLLGVAHDASVLKLNTSKDIHALLEFSNLTYFVPLVKQPLPLTNCLNRVKGKCRMTKIVALLNILIFLAAFYVPQDRSNGYL